MKTKFVLFLTFLSLLTACSKDEVAPRKEINVFVNRQRTGSSANDILSDSKFSSVVVELVYVEGFEPSQTSVNNFVSFLNNRVYKPNGIRVEKRAIVSPGQDVYTIEEIAQIERDERELYNIGDELAIWAYFSDGKSDADNEAENTLVLGTAYWNTSFVIFEETIQGLSNGPLGPNRVMLETTTINHEFGHILGLVNLGSTMQNDHEDPEHEHHCNVSSCLMFWESEVSAGINSMTSVPQLDAQCLADLKANGGK